MNADGSWFALFAAASCRGTILMALLLVFRFVFRGLIPARVLSAAWIVIALVWLVPLTIPTRWSPFNVAPRLQANPQMDVPAPASALVPAYPLTNRTTALIEESVPTPAAAARSLPAKHRALPQGRWLTAIWLGAAGMLIAMRGFLIFRLNRRLSRGATQPEARLTRALREAAAELGLRRTPEIAVTDLVSSPALCGAGRARLLFPSQLAARLTDSELRWVMLHELGHYQRRDLWTLGLLQLAAAVQWFNPFAWLAIRLGMYDTELACDEFVLRHSPGVEPGEYGGVLLRVLSFQRTVDSLPSAVGIIEDKRQLLRRFTMIADFRGVSLGRAIVSFALLVGFALAGMTQEKAPEKTGSLAQVPQPPAAQPPPKGQRYAQGAERLARTVEWEEHAKLELRAVGEVGGVPLALVDVEGEPVLFWNQSSLMGLRIEKIDLAAKEITVINRKKESRVLKLENPDHVVFPKVARDRFLNPQALVRRTENMRSGTTIAPEVLISWSKINREGKLAILMNYLEISGDVVQIITHPLDSGYTVSRGFIFQDQLAAIKREHRDRLIASLSPEQKIEFASTAAPAIRFTDPPDKIEQTKAAAERAKQNSEKFLAGLTPAQETLYDEWVGPSQGPGGANAGPPPQVVQLAGQVRVPGAAMLRSGDNVRRVIYATGGGFTDSAKRDSVVVTRPNSQKPDGVEKIFVDLSSDSPTTLGAKKNGSFELKAGDIVYVP